MFNNVIIANMLITTTSLVKNVTQIAFNAQVAQSNVCPVLTRFSYKVRPVWILARTELSGIFNQTPVIFVTQNAKLVQVMNRIAFLAHYHLFWKIVPVWKIVLLVNIKITKA